MMLSASPSSLARSSLEEMLESLRRRDEDEKPKDLPPALPARPTSRARLPSARRSLPVNYRLGEVPSESLLTEPKPKEEVKRKDEELGFIEGSFGSKKMKKEQNVESPYVAVSEEEKKDKGMECSDHCLVVPEWEDNVGYFMKKKLRVWCHLPTGHWESGMIQSIFGEKAVVSLSNGNVVTVPTGVLFPANPVVLDGVDDLVQLSYLNEPSVLHSIKYRYSRDVIYSKAGPVLIAINPFKEVQIYGSEYETAYMQKLTDSPHVYAMANAAYNQMIRDGVNQSIIISGESGAGKTETAKFAMQYLAALGGGSGGIENKILHTSSILEAFGNAKTLRNDNSSRFGKLIEIHFRTMGNICGANIHTYLLEKTRVVQLGNGERSYHIFYQLCAGAPSILKDKLNLKTASEYKYLNQSNCSTIDGVDDSQKFHLLMEALNVVQIHKEDQEDAFAMLAAVLWLGNTSFQVVDDENHVEVVNDEAVLSAARLMGCSVQELMLVLSSHRIEAGKETTTQRLTLQQAIDTRDALAKFIYASLFDWLVEQINKSLDVGKQQTGKSISILDIHGFESFQKNSFEQFCKNYANERLQQHFNRHLFKLEQEEYESDGINWTKVVFKDNVECLNLFEKKPLGLLSLLDEESNYPKGSDLTFSQKINKHLNSHPCFKEERSGAFSVIHSAGEVSYNTNGFLEKNIDLLHSDFIQLLSSCTCQLPRLFASKMYNQSQKLESPLCKLGAFDSQKQSVATMFKDQLFKLMKQLENTTPHFIRCIKPNNMQLPGMYEDDLVLQQLRCCGILEVVRISRSGYPTRMTHQDFSERYGILLQETNVSQDPLSISVSVLQKFNVLPEMYQVGYTKLFLRSGQIDELEDRRKQILQGVLGVQKCFQGCQTRYDFHELKKGVTTLQSSVRGEIDRRKYDQSVNICTTGAPATIAEQQRAAVQLQSVVRGWLVRRHFNSMRNLEKVHPDNTTPKQKPDRKSSKVKDKPQEPILVLPSVLTELQMRVMKAEALLGKKEEENTALQKQFQQFETRWSEYEAKMKSMEETWEKQITSLQASLAAARKSLATDNTMVQPGRLDTVSSPRYYDSEDAMSRESRTPGGTMPIKFSHATPDRGAPLESNGSLIAVSNLVKEFEQQKQTFGDECKALIEIKGSSTNPDDDLRKLKLRFETWKKEYKFRLRETKGKLREKSRRKWWGKKSSRGSQ